MLNLTWYTHDALGQVYRLFDLDLSTVNLYGVYVVYQGGTLITGPRVIRVGQGVIADRLASHRKDATITAHARNGTLLVAMAAVGPLSIDGVERYLADVYRPLIGDAFPDAVPVAVNLPLVA